MGRFKRPDPERATGPSWLWPLRVPIGELTLIDGDPGLGKSLVALDLATRITTGGALPFAGPVLRGGVIILHGEDPEAVLSRRLLDLGADLDRVRILEGELLLPEGLDDLEEAIEEVGARLVILDPISDFLGFHPGNYYALKNGIRPLLGMSRRRGVALLGLRNLTKGNGSRPMARGLGGMGLMGIARAAYLATPIPGGTALASIKSSYGPTPPALIYRVDAGRVEWVEERPVGEAELGRRPTAAVHEAEDFLRIVLRGGPLPSSDVQSEARSAGITPSALRSARHNLAIQTIAEGVGRLWKSYYWCFPEHTPQPASSQARNGPFAPDEGQRPDRVPGANVVGGIVSIPFLETQHRADPVGRGTHLRVGRRPEGVPATVARSYDDDPRHYREGL